ncbi:MAG: LptE family protein [Planctomycetes bacterium]|nr:LptE family protein [Planctomycetota bacterium]
MTQRTRIPTVLALAVFASTLGGCGYTTHSLIGDDFHTIHVEILGNKTFRRDLEFTLTRDIQDEILSRTNLRIVDRDRADVRLEGDIIDFAENVLSTDERDRIFESSVRVTVRFRLVDQRTGAEMRHFTLNDSAPFLAATGQTNRTATNRTFSDLAEHVVYQLERGF